MISLLLLLLLLLLSSSSSLLLLLLLLLLLSSSLSFISYKAFANWTISPQFWNFLSV